MLKNLPIKLLECRFDDVCNGFGSFCRQITLSTPLRRHFVVEQDDLAFSIVSFLLDSLIHMVQQGYVAIPVDCFE